MNKNRVNSIKKAFKGVGPDSTTLYTNQEIVDLLMELQKTMITGVYEKTHAEYMREKDLMVHFATLAAEYGLKETETYKRFESNMNDLGYTIGSFIKGMKGERIARRALKLLSFNKDVKILYNIALEDEDAQAEYDAIVITPYGLFVVEVKNWGAEMHINENGTLRRYDQDIKYDLPGRMSVKEGLLESIWVTFSRTSIRELSCSPMRMLRYRMTTSGCRYVMAEALYILSDPLTKGRKY